jgi:hypothetical protein
MSGAFKYGDPSNATDKVLGPRPPCWGTSRYDNEDRECRQCGFQHTCREQISKSLKPAATVPTTSYYSQFQPQQSYATPQQIVRAPTAPQVVQVKPQPVPTQQISSGIQDRYGQFQDPMFVTVKGTPSIMRPQLPGESFHQRVMKNMVLASAESALGELMLGVRQLIWAPKSEDKDK